jgi:hypothetical protein
MSLWSNIKRSISSFFTSTKKWPVCFKTDYHSLTNVLKCSSVEICTSGFRPKEMALKIIFYNNDNNLFFHYDEIGKVFSPSQQCPGFVASTLCPLPPSTSLASTADRP